MAVRNTFGAQAHKMIDVDTLLSPELQNSELRAYAYLSTKYAQGVRSPVDCLEPFVIYAIAAFEGQQLEWAKVREFLRDKYGLRIPFYMLDRMQLDLVRAGALRETAIKVYICQDARPSLSSNAVDFSISDIDELGAALTVAATKRGLPKPLTADTWSEIIAPFFLNKSPPGDKQVAKVRGVLVSDPKTYDFTVLAEFIIDQNRIGSRLYKTIEKVYYGVLVAEFLTQIETAGNKASFRDLSIIYDAPVILRLLGCSGRLLQEATEELHESLRELGCKIYYFNHIYDELAEAIEAILKCYENGQPMFRETHEAIGRGEITISQIYACRSELDLRLAALGLVEHATGYHDRSADEFQIDEDAFKRALKSRGSWGRDGSLAAERDVMSLALVMRLRRGRQVRDVSKAGYIFVTHNTRLFRVAREFLREQDISIPTSVSPVMTVGQISTIAWVVNEVFDDDRKITKELIANCYAASIPDEDFDQRLKEIFARTDPNMAHELYQNAFVVQSIRQVALSHTAGQSALVKTLNTAEVLAEAEGVRAQVVADARSAERATAEAELGAQAARRQLEKALRFGKSASRWALAALCVLSLAYTALDLFGEGEKNYVTATVLWVFAVYGALDIFGIVPAASARALLERVFTRLFMWVQHNVS